jgi:hypothetical protein
VLKASASVSDLAALWIQLPPQQQTTGQPRRDSLLRSGGLSRLRRQRTAMHKSESAPCQELPKVRGVSPRVCKVWAGSTFQQEYEDPAYKKQSRVLRLRRDT